MPPSLEERVAYLEGKLEEHAIGFGEIRALLVQLNGRVDAVDQKVDRFREELSSRFNVLDQKMDRFRQDVSRQFNWLVGIQVAIMLSIIGVLLGP